MRTGSHLAESGVNIYAKSGDEPDFNFLACCAGVGRRLVALQNNRLPSIGSAEEGPLLVATKPELREYKCVYVLNDEEIGLFSDEVMVNCAPSRFRVSGLMFT